ncbi:hypothetical protein FBU59_006688 [Linderina macrospora]|uniref:Uncharacterized protein n=1 Tax=Linderina macrospora TaxID=4868 RepID=A0ACC1IZ86_9FUNG|nr:hypothetical protein FBU59_006688 [Linderina macrospora]
MATVLVSVAVFDRETNVRRAASAAFQEHVGRHVSILPSPWRREQIVDVGKQQNSAATQLPIHAHAEHALPEWDRRDPQREA